MQELSLRRCQKVTDAPLIAQAEKRCLRKLIVNNVVSLTDALLVALATHCKYVRLCLVCHGSALWRGH